jgi:beta-phosphoglucomutase-like phosphatase (HAD superfamily)
VHAVIFDFDGVIADTEWLHSTSFRQVLVEEGIHLTDDDHNERFLGVNDRAGFAMALGEVGRTASPAEIMSLVERKSRCYSQRLAEIPLFRAPASSSDRSRNAVPSRLPAEAAERRSGPCSRGTG